jgi:hypothetical protein
MVAPVVGLALTAAAIGGIVKVALRALGIGIISVVGLYGVITALQALIVSQTNLSDVAVLNIMGLARVDEAFNILIFWMNMKLTAMGARRLGLL